MPSCRADELYANGNVAIVNKHQTAAEQAIIPASCLVEALTKPVVDGEGASMSLSLHLACAGQGGANCGSHAGCARLRQLSRWDT